MVKKAADDWNLAKLEIVLTKDATVVDIVIKANLENGNTNYEPTMLADCNCLR